VSQFMMLVLFPSDLIVCLKKQSYSNLTIS
jgi:hypothetical protein